MGHTLLIDGDMLIYRIANAVENVKYKVFQHTFDLKKDAIFYCEDNEIDVENIVKFSIPESKKVTANTLDSFIEQNIEDHFDFPDMIFYVSSKGNFRESVATILKYKGNREDYVKPKRFDYVKSLLLEKYNAIYASPLFETDDEISRDVSKYEDSIIVSIDKDFKQIPTKFFNFVTHEREEVSPIEGLQNFYKQVLTGDSSDNIPGLFGVGKKAACVKRISTMDNEADMFDSVLEEYTKRFHSYAEQFMLENMKLLWLIRDDKEVVPYWMEYFDLTHNYFYDEVTSND